MGHCLSNECVNFKCSFIASRLFTFNSRYIRISGVESNHRINRCLEEEPREVQM